MVFQTAIPDTTIYMIGGYLFIFAVIGIYVASLVIRRRNLKRELEILQRLESLEQGERPVDSVGPLSERKVEPTGTSE